MLWTAVFESEASMNSNLNPDPSGGAGRFIGAVFGIAFLGIGLTVLGFLWGTPFDEFGSPPLFFRIFGSFIAIVFVAVGGGTAYAAITGKNPRSRMSKFTRRNQSDPGALEPPGPESYVYDSCGAPLSSDADVSPLGDVKCSHCQRWFNIHGK